MFIQTIENDWGTWTLLWDEQGIAHFGMNRPISPKPLLVKSLDDFAKRLASYLQGHTVSWPWPLQVQQATPFRQKVWRALQQIPYGETRSYQQVAELCGSPRASRAVGQACSQNPVMIVIPCHRVVGKDGSLTGFAGGIELKEKLLALEQTRCQSKT